MTPSVARQIRAARLARGLTQEALAARAGLRGKATVSDVEAGADARLSTLQALADALGVEVRLVPGGSLDGCERMAAVPPRRASVT